MVSEYKHHFDLLRNLDMKESTIIYRLCTGHCGLQSHLQRTGVANSSPCSCGQGEQTPYHILQDCPLFEVQHQQTWPEDLDTQIKLQGMKADLKATAQFLTSTNLRIWCRRRTLRKRRGCKWSHLDCQSCAVDGCQNACHLWGPPAY
jgi:hypothetical protein